MLAPRFLLRSLLAALLFTSLGAYAYNYAGLDASNRLGQRIYVGPTTTEKFVIAVTDRGAETTSREFLLSKECPEWHPSFGSAQLRFSCLSGGLSPLAGATYRFEVSKKLDDCRERTRLYRCVAGCGPQRVPSQIKMLHYEC